MMDARCGAGRCSVRFRDRINRSNIDCGQAPCSAGDRGGKYSNSAWMRKSKLNWYGNAQVTQVQTPKAENGINSWRKSENRFKFAETKLAFQRTM